MEAFRWGVRALDFRARFGLADFREDSGEIGVGALMVLRGSSTM